MNSPFLLAQSGSSLLTDVSSASKAAAQTSSQIVTTFLTSVGFLTNLALSIGILIAFYILGKLMARKIVHWLQDAKGESLYPDMIVLVNRFVVVGSLFVGFAIAIQFVFEMDFLQVVGFFGLGISFAFKDVLSNLIAGAMIIIQNRFRIGDFIQIGVGSGLRGKVMEIQTRATILKAIDGSEIVVPNSQLIVKPVITYTAHKSRRIDIEIKVHFTTDLNAAKEKAIEVMSAKEHVLKKPKPRVIVKKIADSAVILSCRFYIDPQDKSKSWVITKSELTQEIKEAFDTHGIKIPYPVEVYLENDPNVPGTPPTTQSS